jgi:hypothetical protein
MLFLAVLSNMLNMCLLLSEVLLLHCALCLPLLQLLQLLQQLLMQYCYCYCCRCCFLFSFILMQDISTSIDLDDVPPGHMWIPISIDKFDEDTRVCTHTT